MNMKMHGSHVDMEILVGGSSAPTPLYPHGGASWVESADGQPFQVRVTNRHSGRVLVLCAVDGRGIIIPAGGSYTFRGWRTSNDQTRAFLFTTPGQGVAAQVGGDLGMVGQIGIAVFTERATEWYVPAVGRSATYDNNEWRGGPPVAMAAPAPAPTHAAGIGAAQDDRVAESRFDRDRLVQVADVYYRDRATLAAMGIVFGLRPSYMPPVTGYARLTSPAP